MKKCKSCNKTKDISLFGKNRTYKDGHDSKCKDCRYELVKAYRSTERGRESARGTVRRYHQSQKGKAAKRKYEVSDKGRENRRFDSIKHKNRYPEKKRAREIAYYAIKSGKIAAASCVVCGNDRAHAHHENYNKPLELTWLCVKHHSERHKNESLPLDVFVESARAV